MSDQARPPPPGASKTACSASRGGNRRAGRGLLTWSPTSTGGCPRRGSPTLLLEVDDATRFTEAFTHLRTGEPCRDRIGLLNVLLAEGINLGLRKMAEATKHARVLGVDAHCPLARGRPRPRYRWPPSGAPGGAGQFFPAAGRPGAAAAARAKPRPTRWAAVLAELRTRERPRTGTAPGRVHSRRPRTRGPLFWRSPRRAPRPAGRDRRLDFGSPAQAASAGVAVHLSSTRPVRRQTHRIPWPTTTTSPVRPAPRPAPATRLRTGSSRPEREASARFHPLVEQRCPAEPETGSRRLQRVGGVYRLRRPGVAPIPPAAPGGDLGAQVPPRPRCVPSDSPRQEGRVGSPHASRIHRAGAMGRPMALNLLRGRHEVTVYARRASHASPVPGGANAPPGRRRGRRSRLAGPRRLARPPGRTAHGTLCEPCGAILCEARFAFTGQHPPQDGANRCTTTRSG